VNEGKLILWLKEVILPRGSNVRGKGKGKMLSTSGLEGYIKPIIALWEVLVITY
jgi:hypothetical protein